MLLQQEKIYETFFLRYKIQWRKMLSKVRYKVGIPSSSSSSLALWSHTNDCIGASPCVPSIQKCYDSSLPSSADCLRLQRVETIAAPNLHTKHYRRINARLKLQCQNEEQSSSKVFVVVIVRYQGRGGRHQLHSVVPRCCSVVQIECLSTMIGWRDRCHRGNDVGLNVALHRPCERPKWRWRSCSMRFHHLRHRTGSFAPS